MAQQLQNITVQAPGFAGINSQDSPVSLDYSFAATASNCIIDEYGRIGARKGYKEVSTDSSTATELGDSRGIEAIHEYVKRDGTKIVFSAGNNKIFTGTTTLTPVTLPTDYTITANDWKIVTFNDDVFFFQRNHAALHYDSSAQSGNPTLILSEDSNHSAPEAHEGIGAYGRLWAADVSGNKHTVYWSDLLIGNKWHGGTSGSLNLTNVFPTGDDEVVSLSAHNGFLIIFCKRSIIIYSGASSPANMVLHDTVEGVGCIARDSVQHTGTDIIFLSEDGVRSFGRTIQEKSMPMRDISNNVRTELTSLVRTQTNPIKSIYSADEAFYLLSLQDSNTVYCFDMRSALPDGANRVTTWAGVNPRSLALLDDGSIYLGREDGIFEYGGYLDKESTYVMLYYSNPLNFGNSTNLKFLKKFNITVIGNVASQTTLAWGYDYATSFIKKPFNTDTLNVDTAEFFDFEDQASATEGIANNPVGQFGDTTTTKVTPNTDVARGIYLGAFASAPTSNIVTNNLYYNTTESQLYYWSGSAWEALTQSDSSYVVSKFTTGIDIQRPSINTNGSGSVVTIGIESTIDGAPYSIQQIDVHALLGRLI